MKFTRIVLFILLWGLICPGLLQGQEQPKGQGTIDQERLKEEIAKRWDPERYDKYPGHLVDSDEEVAAWRKLFGKLIPGKGLRVLDAGCGTGEISFLLAGMGYEVYGLDISEKMVAKAREKAKTRAKGDAGLKVHFELGDAEKPPFPDDFFDAVVCKHLLWTLPSPQTALDSWTRILKENGKVIVIDALWDDGSLATRLRRKLGRCLRYIMGKDSSGSIFSIIFRSSASSGSAYSPAMRAALPNVKGVPLEKAKAYMEKAGLRDIQDVNINYLHDIQKKKMPFWCRVSRTWDYYAVCGQKRSQQ